jgi:hypothetical protein
MASAGAPIKSQQFISYIGNQGLFGTPQPYYGYTSTLVNQNGSGQVTGGTTTYYHSPSPNKYIPAAVTKDNGKTWTYLDSSGNAVTAANSKDAVLGTSAQISLQSGALKTNVNNAINSAGIAAGIPQTQANNLLLKNNTASNNTQTPTQSGTQTPPQPAVKADEYNNIDIKEKPGQKSYNQDFLKYPSNLSSTGMDYVRFTALKYGNKVINDNATGFGARTLPTITDGIVAIGIQPSISDQNTVDWNGLTMNAFDQALSALSLGIAEGEGDKAVSRVQKTIQQEGSNVASAIQLSLAGEAAGTKGLLTRVTGAILNPNLELLFQGPSLRPFNFTFKMSPRNKSEAQNVKYIIRFFKENMAARRSTQALFLKSPNVFKIEYIYSKTGENHPALNRIKECALLSCSVDYTPESSYMTFEEDGTMVSYNITMQFQELEPVYYDDYENLKNNLEVGY